MIDILERMGGGAAVGEVPGYYYYYPHGTYMEGGPRSSSSSWVPAYTYPHGARRGNGSGYYYYDDGDVGYGDAGNAGDAEVFFVDFPTRHGVPRKRKLDRGIGERSSDGGKTSVEGNGQVDSTPERKPAQSRAGAGSFVVPVEGPSPASKSGPGKSNSDVAMEPAVMSPPAQTEDVKVTKSTMEPSEKLAVSAEDAAVVVQSLFRGYNVRKTKPLVQLRLIAGIRAQLSQLELKVADPDFVEYAREHTTSRLKLNENIMRLLFQLDGIQGVNSEVRGIRKSLTRKVIAFQENVDKLFSHKEDAMEVDGKVEDEMVTECSNSTSLNHGSSVDASEMNGEESNGNHGNTDVQSGLAEMNIESSEDNKSADVPVDGGVEDDSNSGQFIVSRGHVTNARADPPYADEAVDRKEQLDEQSSLINAVVNEVGREVDGDSQTDMVTSIHPNHGINNGELLESATSRVAESQLDSGVNLGALEDWIDVHVDDRTAKWEDDAVNTTAMERDSGGRDEQHMVVSLQSMDEKQAAEATGMDTICTRDDVMKPAGDFELSALFAPGRDITAGAALIDSRNSLTSRDSGTAALEGKEDKDVLLRKLANENQMLKSMLLGVMRWNQIQAGSMSELNNRLESLEKSFARASRRTRKIGDDELKRLTKMFEPESGAYCTKF